MVENIEIQVWFCLIIWAESEKPHFSQLIVQFLFVKRVWVIFSFVTYTLQEKAASIPSLLFFVSTDGLKDW